MRIQCQRLHTLQWIFLGDLEILVSRSADFQASFDLHFNFFMPELLGFPFPKVDSELPHP